MFLNNEHESNVSFDTNELKVQQKGRWYHSNKEKMVSWYS